MPSSSRRLGSSLMALCLGLSLGQAEARAPDTGPASRLDSAAVPARYRALRPPAPPIRLGFEPTDMISVSQAADLQPWVIRGATDGAKAAGARSVVGRSASIQMVRLRRGSRTIQAPPAGWQVPFGATVLSTRAVHDLMGPLVASGIGKPGNLVMARSSAEMRGAQVGDVMEFRSVSNGIVPVAISLVVPDDMLAGAELVLSGEDASRIGVSQPGRIVIWDFDSRREIMDELESRGIVDSSTTGTLGTTDSRIRLRRSWGPLDPDTSLGLLRTKVLLGEFAFRISESGDSIAISQSWMDHNLDCGPINYCRRQLNDTIPIRARCHRNVVPAVQGALDEVARKGLAWTIDVGNANTIGGCFVPRFNRLATSTAIGNISRHTWGMALDTNTSTNGQGSTPHMDCRTVQIFRRWGFAWGGNYTTPDGMHFEFVGERRDRLSYPSKWCPNDVPSGRGGPLAPEDTERSRFFGDDGLVVGDGD